MKKKMIAVSALTVLALTALAGIACVLVWNGIVLLNNPSTQKYPVRGVDVSSYQGEIDWEMLAAQNISFAFIKATEGSGYVDPRFAFNYMQAQKTPLRIGAYHFFSYDSEGKTQAENFIATVEKIDGMLPPVVDLEFYGDKQSNPPPRDEVHRELQTILSVLEAHYGIKPIIYTTEPVYVLYLENAFETYDIWIRNVITKPDISDNRAWKFWQYTNRERLKGYNGQEKFIDMNVFAGSAEGFACYPQ